MLILSRRDGESIQIGLDPTAPPGMTVAELFASGPILVMVMVMGQHDKQTKLGIDAPRSLAVSRLKLVARPNTLEP